MCLISYRLIFSPKTVVLIGFLKSLFEGYLRSKKKKKMHATATITVKFSALGIHLSKEISFVDELQLQNSRTKSVDLGVYVGKCRSNCGPCTYVQILSRWSQLRQRH